MANMNITSPTAAKIYASWLKAGQREAPRRYLGASIAGHECDAYLWLSFRQAAREAFDGRMYRLFDRGRREEAAFCEDLRRIGCEVREFGDDGKQWAVSAFGGHFGGHLDGLAKGFPEAPGKWHVVEFKTHSDSSFRKLCKDGVKKAKPMHYAQMQLYMGRVGLDCAMYMAVNKDNDDLWCERVKFDETFFAETMARVKRIIDTTSPDRCASRRDDWRCKACQFAPVCWHDAKQFVDPLVPVSCRTCCHATADTEGEGAKWTCRIGHECSGGEKCPDHLFLPQFVLGTPVDGDDYGIKYDYGKGEIVLGRAGISSSDAQKFGPDHAPSVTAFLGVCEGAKLEESNTVKVKYSAEKFEEIFSGTVDELKAWIPFHPVADFSRPLVVQKSGGETAYEYARDVAVFVKDGRASVMAEKCPF